jgi:NMD protein affecting ribosome stability and mRNA decay
MDEHECGCSQATSINELCPRCRFEYEEYLATMVRLRKSVAPSQSTEGKDADAA